MSFFSQRPSLHDLQRRGLLFPLVVLAAVLVVLVHGALQRPPAPVAVPVASPPARPPLLRPDLEKAPLAYLSDYWLQLGERALGGMVRLGREELPAVVVAPGLAVTSLSIGATLRLETKLAAGDSNAAAPFESLGAEPELGVAFVGLEGESQVLELARPGDARPGALVATVSMRPDGGLRITPSHLTAPVGEGSDSLELSVLPPEVNVGAVVDLEGRLLGVAVSDAGAGLRLPSARALGAAVERVRAHEPCRAVEVEAPQPAVLELLGVSGLVVERVRVAAWAEGPPFRPGDVLLRFAGQPVGSVSEFTALYDAAVPDQAVSYAVMRGRARVTGRARMPGRDCRPVPPPLLRLGQTGLVLAWDPGGPGWRVADVGAETPAARAGIERGDVLLGADGRALASPDSRSRLEALEGRRGPALLTLRRGPSVTLRALPPPGRGPERG